MQGAFTISPIHDRPLQIGGEDGGGGGGVGVGGGGGGGVFDKYIFRPPALWWFTQPLVFGFRVGAFIW